MISRNELERRFTYHPPPDAQTRLKHETVNELLFEVALKLVSLTSDGREQSTMVTKLEEARSWAHAAIARPKE